VIGRCCLRVSVSLSPSVWMMLTALAAQRRTSVGHEVRRAMHEHPECLTEPCESRREGMSIVVTLRLRPSQAKEVLQIPSSECSRRVNRCCEASLKDASAMRRRRTQA